MRDIIEKLKSDPEIENIYFNKEGGWNLNRKDNFPIHRTREEVLAMEADLPAQVEKIPDADLVEENKLLKEQVALLTDENKKLQEKTGDQPAEWTEERENLQLKISGLEEQITKLAAKKKK